MLPNRVLICSSGLPNHEALAGALRISHPSLTVKSMDDPDAAALALTSAEVLAVIASPAAVKLIGNAPESGVACFSAFVPAIDTSISNDSDWIPMSILPDGSCPTLQAALTGLLRGMERMQKQSESYGRRYEDLVQALPDIVYELDINDRFSLVNDSIKLLGYTPQELLGKHYSALLYNEDVLSMDRETLLSEYSGERTGLALSPKLFNERRGINRKTSGLEVRLRKKNAESGAVHDMIGEVISYGEVSAAGTYAEKGDGSLKGSVGIIRDVTLRRKSEEMLRKLYQAVDQLSVSVFIVNHLFEIEYVNPLFFMLTGFTPTEVIGTNIFKYLAVLPEKAAEMRKQIQDGLDLRDEVVVPKQNDGQFWAEISVSPVRSPSGIISHAIAIIDDISSRKTMEDLLRSTRLEAENATLTKTKFLSSMTHELKNPITGILSAANLVKAQPEQIDRRMDSIIENAQALLSMLSGILDYVRSEGGEARTQKLVIPLKPFVENLCAPYMLKARSKGLSFQIKEISEGNIETDPDRLQRALTTIVDNAVKFTESGTIEIAAIIEREEMNVPHLSFTVRDTGVGIINSEKEQVFIPFSQSHKGARPHPRGAGIGLALARNLVRTLGGEIRLDSKDGQGSVFTLIVPVGSPVSTQNDYSPSAYVVLLVDDNEINLKYLSTLVQNFGYRVLTANGASEAFRILEDRYVDVAILDIQMPGYSGIELAKAIRAYAGSRYSPNMPLFAMTAFNPEEMEEMGDTGKLFQEVFVKPVDVRKLTVQIEEAIMPREIVPLAFINAAFTGRDLEQVAAMETLEETVTKACTALRNVLKGNNRARIDVKAETGKIIQVFNRFAYNGGVELTKLFFEHYTDEDHSVLNGLINRIERMVVSVCDKRKNQKGRKNDRIDS